MAKTKNLQVLVSEDEQATLNAAAVRLTTLRGKPCSVQDLVHAWIATGCPLPKPKKHD
jgi:hypothetical protein